LIGSLWKNFHSKVSWALGSYFLETLLTKGKQIPGWGSQHPNLKGGSESGPQGHWPQMGGFTTFLGHTQLGNTQGHIYREGKPENLLCQGFSHTRARSFPSGQRGLTPHLKVLLYHHSLDPSRGEFPPQQGYFRAFIKRDLSGAHSGGAFKRAPV